MTDANAQVLWWRDQTPFGQTVAEGGFSVSPLHFPGQYADAESGLAYNYFRDYDPALGRYIQSDPIGLGGGLNTYGYVGGNPMARVDPKGLDSESLGSIGDFIRNYNEMRSANTVGADKFFHCKANCEAAQRGESGNETARNLSDYREWFDQNVKGDSLEESEADQFANCYGRRQGTRRPNTPCHYICEPFRPKEGGVPVR